MKHYSLGELKARIQASFAADPDAVPVQDILVTAPDDPADLDFLVRVMILVEDAEAVDPAVARKMRDDVRRAFQPEDERVVSIRFSEPF